MKSIIPEISQSTTFDKLIQASMDMFISEGEVFSPWHLKCMSYAACVGPHSHLPSGGYVTNFILKLWDDPKNTKVLKEQLIKQIADLQIFRF